MLRALLVLFVFALPAKAEDKKVTITFLGGARKVPLEGVKVSIRGDTGDWTADLKNKTADGKTGNDGTANFTLTEGKYYVDIDSAKELPYLFLPVGYKGHPSHYGRRIRVGDKTSFEYNLADACRLTLRAVDAATEEGLPGAVFVTENELAEDWAAWINGNNLGTKLVGDREENDTLKTDADGNFTRLIGPRPGYTYYVWIAPPGYEIPDKRGEIVLESPIGKEKVEHVFKFKKKK